MHSQEKNNQEKKHLSAADQLTPSDGLKEQEELNQAEPISQMINSSPQVRQLHAMQSLINNSQQVHEHDHIQALISRKEAKAPPFQLQKAPQPILHSVVQRVGLNDNSWHTATAVTRSGAGADGVYFVDFADGTRLVVKLSEGPEENLENDAFFADMGINAPESRSVTKGSAEGVLIDTQITTHLAQANRGEYTGNHGTATDFIIMTTVPGNSFRSGGGVALRAALRNNNVLRAIGKQAIGDAFLGIGDRLLENQNPGNLMFDAAGTVYAIDNETTHHAIPMGGRMERIRQLLDWNGANAPEWVRNFAQRAAVTNGVNALEVVNLVRTRNALTQIKNGIAEGFRDLVTAAGNVQEESNLYNLSQEVIALSAERASRSPCFITTACVRFKGLDDNCRQLAVLRNFRDHFLMTQPNGNELVSVYYQFSPLIVDGINRNRNAAGIYEYLFLIIEQCVNLIEQGENHKAMEIYCEMVIKLAKQYFPQQAKHDRRK